ncbi:hypothetical protein [Clostridium psychrophilum]|uniref:hypothetical protein n=1 Tax=Clostridium psychrophilum TaxID=132926 RepID=UPI001C0D8CF4|nr:hypothetical protein [Clostridium psychrophilum]MBU3182177.1 hypothetical protein [Clostridium psychrophilum]
MEICENKSILYKLTSLYFRMIINMLFFCYLVVNHVIKSKVINSLNDIANKYNKKVELSNIMIQDENQSELQIGFHLTIL